MKRVEAYIRMNKLDAVMIALDAAGIQGLTCTQVRGYGRQMGRTDQFRGSADAVSLLPKMKIEVVVKDSELELAIQTLITAAETGEIGDGKIFVSDISDAIRIRTRERGEDAVS